MEKLEDQELERGLKASGWHLSSDGLDTCKAQCKQKGWRVTVTNLIKIALEVDLRSVGAGVLSEDISRNLVNEVSGPIVLQIQKIKNVATPSTKQYDPSPSKRLLKLQLTDGRVHAYVTAVEFDGAINNVSPATPPGTKVKLVGKVNIQNSFLLLKKTSLEVLGGTVEVLYKKWNSQKMMSQGNLQRSKIGAGSGPPLFTPLKDFTGVAKTFGGNRGTVSEDRHGQSKKTASSDFPSKSSQVSKRRGDNEYKSSSSTRSNDRQKPEGREERHKLEQPGRTSSRERAEGGSGNRNPSKDAAARESRERGGGREHSYQAEHSDRDRRMGGLSKGSHDRDFPSGAREDTSHVRGRKEQRGRGRQERVFNDQRYLPSSSEHRSVGESVQRTEDYQSERGSSRRGRGRGRGRRGRRNQDDDDDSYQPSSRPAGGYSLGDWFEQKLTIKDKPHSSHFGWYEEDYEDVYLDDRYEYEQKEKRGTHREDNTVKTRTKKEAWLEEYPPMPASTKPSSTPQQPVATGDSHWDWVGMTTGCGAPSTARKL